MALKISPGDSYNNTFIKMTEYKINSKNIYCPPIYK